MWVCRCQLTKDGERHEFKTSGISWDRDKIVVAEIREVIRIPTRTG